MHTLDPPRPLLPEEVHQIALAVLLTGNPSRVYFPKTKSGSTWWHGHWALQIQYHIECLARDV